MRTFGNDFPEKKSMLTARRVAVILVALAVLVLVVMYGNAEEDVSRKDMVTDAPAKSKCVKMMADEWDSVRKDTEGRQKTVLADWMAKNPDRFNDAVVFGVGGAPTRTDGWKGTRNNVGLNNYHVHMSKVLEKGDDPRVYLIWDDNTTARVIPSTCRVAEIFLPAKERKLNPRVAKNPIVRGDLCGRWGECSRKKADGTWYKCEVPAGGIHCPAHFSGYTPHGVCQYGAWDDRCVLSNVRHCPSQSNCLTPSCPLQSKDPCTTVFDPIIPPAASRTGVVVNQLMGFVNAINKGIPVGYSRAISIVTFIVGQATSTHTNTLFLDLQRKIAEAVTDLRRCIDQTVLNGDMKMWALRLQSSLTTVDGDLKPSAVTGDPTLRETKFQIHETSCETFSTEILNHIIYTSWQNDAYVLPLVVPTAQTCTLLFAEMVADGANLTKSQGWFDIRRTKFSKAMGKVLLAVRESIYVVDKYLNDANRCSYFKDANDMRLNLINGYRVNVLQKVQEIVDPLVKKCFPRLYNYQYHAGAGLASFLIDSVDLCEAECKKNINCGCYVMHGFTCWLNSQCLTTIGAFGGATSSICTDRTCSNRILNEQYSCSVGLTSFLIDSVDLCEAECLKDSRCHGYVMHGFTCWLNSECTRTKAPFLGATSAVCR